VHGGSDGEEGQEEFETDKLKDSNVAATYAKWSPGSMYSFGGRLVRISTVGGGRLLVARA
jgi:hypothetical protein